ncbi:uncharacterized protein LOC100574717 [Acyrthosiphon pisum]|uniref:Uncharacterized protein n=1 Tax=Acyrthosiphon pisum TaxID=7029 RepID=A0A8R1W736_ACYPI|nr:uncharacterized protein LOC100574717 [Acyrthosiphon pisum]|eukprot:XP_003247883.1 PREDICTED: uncharacterized protein LOC100574717 [Acyrthosiphon pisum]
MSDNYSDDNDSLNLTVKERIEKFSKEHNFTVNETSLKFQRLISIFEKEESETKFKSLSQRRLKTATTKAAEVTRKAERSDGVDEAEDADEADVSSTDGSERSDHRPAQGVAVPSGRTSSTSAAYTSTVSVTNHGGGWIGHPERNLLFVIHPWCMLHKSGVDRQSEFPPPGFLERLKAKLMALHCQSDEQQRHSPSTATVVRRRRHTHQRIKCWFQYTATALGDGGSTAMTTVHAAYPRNEPASVVDFLSVWQRCANSVAAACRAADRD